MFKNFNAMMREEKGFSMIELIIVIAIIGIIGAVVAPMFGSATVGARVSADIASVDTIQTALELRYTLTTSKFEKDDEEQDLNENTTGVEVIKGLIIEERIARNTDTEPQTEDAVFRFNWRKRRMAVDFRPAINTNPDVEQPVKDLPTNQKGLAIISDSPAEGYANHEKMYGKDTWK